MDLVVGDGLDALVPVLGEVELAHEEVHDVSLPPLSQQPLVGGVGVDPVQLELHLLGVDHLVWLRSPANLETGLF